MGIRRGSISTPIIADGLMFNIDAANRASYIPDTTTTYNTMDFSQSGSLFEGVGFVGPPTASWLMDGTDDYMLKGPSTTVPNQFTFSVWYKPTDLTGEGYGYFLSYDVPASGNDKGFAIDEGGGVIGAGKCYYYNGGGSPTTIATTALSVNTWACLTFVTDVTGNEIKFYLNGLLDKTTTQTLISTTYNYMGTWGATDNHYLKGQLANAHIYNRALSTSEVLHNYNALKGRFA